MSYIILLQVDTLNQQVVSLETPLKDIESSHDLSGSVQGWRRPELDQIQWVLLRFSARTDSAMLKHGSGDQ